jgi:hypothetical protein
MSRRNSPMPMADRAASSQPRSRSVPVSGRTAPGGEPGGGDTVTLAVEGGDVTVGLPRVVVSVPVATAVLEMVEVVMSVGVTR